MFRIPSISIPKKVKVVKSTDNYTYFPEQSQSDEKHLFLREPNSYCPSPGPQ